MSSSRLAAAAGIVGAALLNLVFLIEGALRPGYSSVHDFISELSLGPRGFIQKSSFMVCGALIAFSSLALGREFRPDGARLPGPRLIALVGVSLVLAGIFDTDPFPRTGVTLHGLAHDLAAGTCFSAMGAACFVLGRRFRALDRWADLERLARWCGGVTLVFFALVIVGFPLPWKPAVPWVTDHLGLLQRVAQAAFFVCWVRVSVRLATRVESAPC